MPDIKRFGDLQKGDIIAGPDGGKVTVTETYDEHIPDYSYDVELDDKNRTVLNVSGSHLWYVETDLHIEQHRRRVKDAKRILKHISADAIDCLEYMASIEDQRETSVQELVEILGDSTEIKELVFRVARSVGPIVEQNTTLVDENGNQIGTEKERLYDGPLMAQQILALYNKRKYKWKVIIGEVMDTHRLFMVQDIANIPEA